MPQVEYATVAVTVDQGFTFQVVEVDPPPPPSDEIDPCLGEEFRFPTRDISSEFFSNGTSWLLSD